MPSIPDGATRSACMDDALLHQKTAEIGRHVNWVENKWALPCHLYAAQDESSLPATALPQMMSPAAGFRSQAEAEDMSYEQAEPYAHEPAPQYVRYAPQPPAEPQPPPPQAAPPPPQAVGDDTPQQVYGIIGRLQQQLSLARVRQDELSSALMRHAANPLSTHREELGHYNYGHGLTAAGGHGHAPATSAAIAEAQAAVAHATALGERAAAARAEMRRDSGPLTSEVLERGLAEELVRLRAQLAGARLATEAAEQRARDAQAEQAAADRNALEAARSCETASRAAEELRGQMVAMRRQADSSEQSRGIADGQARSSAAEVHAVRTQLKGKWSECEQLRVELTQTRSLLDRREIIFARREAEMRQVRTRALAMVHALRTATSGLGDEHAAAAAVLNTHFHNLERSLSVLPAEPQR